MPGINAPFVSSGKRFQRKFLFKEEFTRNWFRKCALVLAMPALKAVKGRVDPRRYNGASLLGLKGTVVKSHGSADIFAFECALEQALLEVDGHVIERTAQKMAELANRQLAEVA